MPGHLPAPPLPALAPPDAPPAAAEVPPSALPLPDVLPLPELLLPLPAVLGPGNVFVSLVPLQPTTEEPSSKPVAAAMRKTTCLNLIFTCNILCFGVSPRKKRLQD